MDKPKKRANSRHISSVQEGVAVIAQSDNDEVRGYFCDASYSPVIYNSDKNLLATSGFFEPVNFAESKEQIGFKRRLPHSVNSSVKRLNNWLNGHTRVKEIIIFLLVYAVAIPLAFASDIFPRWADNMAWDQTEAELCHGGKWGDPSCDDSTVASGQAYDKYYASDISTMRAIFMMIVSLVYLLLRLYFLKPKTQYASIKKPNIDLTGQMDFEERQLIPSVIETGFDGRDEPTQYIKYQGRNYLIKRGLFGRSASARPTLVPSSEFDSDEDVPLLGDARYG